MSDDKIRKHVREALIEAVKVAEDEAEAEKTRQEAVEAEEDEIRAANAKEMKPLIDLIRALKDEITDVEGLVIYIYPFAGEARIKAERPYNKIEYHVYRSLKEDSIYALHGIGIDESETFFLHSNLVEEVMAKVVDLVGRHIHVVRD